MPLIMLYCHHKHSTLLFLCPSDINILLITDPPRVQLSLTNAGPGNVVKVGDTLYLQCNVLSNPPVEKVYWKFQVCIHVCRGMVMRT